MDAEKVLDYLAFQDAVERAISAPPQKLKLKRTLGTAAAAADEYDAAQAMRKKKKKLAEEREIQQMALDLSQLGASIGQSLVQHGSEAATKVIQSTLDNVKTGMSKKLGQARETITEKLGNAGAAAGEKSVQNAMEEFAKLKIDSVGESAHSAIPLPAPFAAAAAAAAPTADSTAPVSTNSVLPSSSAHQSGMDSNNYLLTTNYAVPNGQVLEDGQMEDGLQQLVSQFGAAEDGQQEDGEDDEYASEDGDYASNDVDADAQDAPEANHVAYQHRDGEYQFVFESPPFSEEQIDYMRRYFKNRNVATLLSTSRDGTHLTAFVPKAMSVGDAVKDCMQQYKQIHRQIRDLESRM